MKIDLHTHTSEHSGCAVSTEREQIEAAIRYGLDAIAITDHNVLCDPVHISELNKKYAPFKIYPGIEIRVRNYNEDFIVLGVQDEDLEKRLWDYEDLHCFVREKNGYVLLCHPYRFQHSVPDAVTTYIPDAVEIHSTNIGGCDCEQITELAKKLNIKTVANSDSHSMRHIGMYYNILDAEVETETELVAELKKGAYGFGCDEMRIREYNAVIGDREIYIKQLMEEGQSAEYFSRTTNMWRGYYDRVAMGKSYIVKERPHSCTAQ